jgi:hypothetical protein
MFPRFREQLGTALDLIVEFSTLGEYRLGVDCAHGAPSAPAVAPGHAPQLGGAGSPAGRAAVRRIVAGGATGRAPVATPAARRLLASAEARRLLASAAARRLLASAEAADRPPSAPPLPPVPAFPSPALFSPRSPEAAERTVDPCRGDRRRPAVPRRVRARPRAAPEQLCFAV